MLLLLENAPLREAADVVSQPWFKLYSFLSTWRSDIDMEAWAHSTKGLASHPQGFQRQLDAIAALRPEHVSPTHWSMLVEDRLRQAVRSGYQWEELLSSWVALYCKIAQCLQAAAAEQGRGSSAVGAAGSAEQAAAALRELPEFDAFLLHMFTLEADPQAQLDFVAEFKPPAMSQANWDTEVGKVREACVDGCHQPTVTVMTPPLLRLTKLLVGSCQVAGSCGKFDNMWPGACSAHVLLAMAVCCCCLCWCS